MRRARLPPPPADAQRRMWWDLMWWVVNDSNGDQVHCTFKSLYSSHSSVLSPECCRNRSIAFPSPTGEIWSWLHSDPSPGVRVYNLPLLLQVYCLCSVSLDKLFWIWDLNFLICKMEVTIYFMVLSWGLSKFMYMKSLDLYKGTY